MGFGVWGLGCIDRDHDVKFSGRPLLDPRHVQLAISHGFRASGLGLLSPPPHTSGHILRSTMALDAWHVVLGNSWYLLNNYNCTYDPLISPLSALIWL